MFTQQAPFGVTFDFNCGLRVCIPPNLGDTSRKIRITDGDGKTQEVGFRDVFGEINSPKTYFQKWNLEVLEDDKIVFEHPYNCEGKKVLIFIVGALGDTLAWMGWVSRFQDLHDCELIVAMNNEFIDMFQPAYPEIEFLNIYEVRDTIFEQNSIYAFYIIAFDFGDEENHKWIPIHYKHIGLYKTAPYILGLDPNEECKPAVTIANGQRPIDDKYVVIAVESTIYCKMWNNPNGWPDVIKHLKSLGYRVVCVDRNPTYSAHLDCEHETGGKPLPEIARWLKHADIMVGLSSGLSWLAWAVDTPVVMISGFTHPMTEFYTPYRVINWQACNSCWNDTSINVGVGHQLAWEWCPRHKDTPREYECSKLISSEQVITEIDKALSCL